MSSTNAASSSPRPVEAMAKSAQAGARAPREKPEGADIFSSMLNLLASTQVPPEAAGPPPTTAGDNAPDGSTSQEDNENPLTALMSLRLPDAADSLLGKKAGAPMAVGELGLPGAAWSAERAATGRQSGSIDITGMTPVESTPLELAPNSQAALPANALRRGAAPAFLARTAVASTSAGATPPWRHGSPATTETRALQQAANQASQVSLVRSTVALNDRFGIAPSVSLAPTERREVPTEAFNLSTSVVAGNRSSDTAPALTGAAAGDASAMGSDSASSDANHFDQAEAQADNPFAEASANEEPPLTHWGTQHLRHASLRVGGEAGEKAIDIQLSMKGQEVQVEFATDSAEARASLRESAGNALGDLLAKSGIQLGSVSVGAQSQQGFRGDEKSAGKNSVKGLTQTAPLPEAGPSRPAQAAPRADGSQPLDVFV